MKISLQNANCSRIGGRILLPRVNNHKPWHTAI
nr:MAG TPA: ubiquitin-binding zinc finger protein [Caudoviricetes sp.]